MENNFIKWNCKIKLLCFNDLRKQYETKYKIYGREYNVESTKVMFDYLCEAIERLNKTRK